MSDKYWNPVAYWWSNIGRSGEFFWTGQEYGTLKLDFLSPMVSSAGINVGAYVKNTIDCSLIILRPISFEAAWASGCGSIMSVYRDLKKESWEFLWDEIPKYNYKEIVVQLTV